MERTMLFAVGTLSMVDHLPNGNKGWEIGRQLIRSGTGIGANVREADHALTDADFAHKCSIAHKEASETCYWLELCKRTQLLTGDRLDKLLQEAEEITRVLASIVKRTQDHINRNR
jgi:four helix bundle protein